MVDVLADAQALGAGLLIGNDRGLSSSANQLFQAASIQHLTAASGANLGLAVWLAGPLLYPWNYRLKHLGKGIVYAVYWLIAGGSGSLWRASVMALLLWFSHCLGRKTAQWYVWLFTILVGQLSNVSYYRTKGFWLSAAAVLGMLFSQKVKPGENYMALLPQWQRWVKSLFLPIYFGLIVTIFVLPFLWQFFGQLSLNSAFSTALASPFIFPLQLTALFFFGSQHFLRWVAPWLALCLVGEYRLFTHFIRQFVNFIQSSWFVLFSVMSLIVALRLGFRVCRLIQQQRYCQKRYQIWQV